MEVVTGALPTLLPKLADLLVGEYNLQKEVKGGIIFLQAELESMQGALEKISKKPADEIADQDKIWARNVREMSYDIEDTIDAFMVRCKGRKAAKQHGFKAVIDKSLDLLLQPKVRRKIATEIRDIKSRVEEEAKRRDRYKISSDVGKPVTIDPRLLAQYEKAIELVGIDEATEEVIKLLLEGNGVSKQEDKIVSIVGFGGLGKTTLANAVYRKLRAQFDCSAFVSVSQTPDMDKLLKDMLYQLAKKHAPNVICELREFLEEKRYFIVIDDIWDISVWKMIKHALPDNNVGNKIIITTRILNVAEKAGGAYKLKPLSQNNSRKLLYRRVFGNENKEKNEDPEKCPDEELAEISDKILKKCVGVPLAIITMASLLACKRKNKMEWYEVYNSVGRGLENNLDVDNMRKILSFSYYDLPSHLRTCLLYLSIFPEDFKIEKDRLIRMWIGEGFIRFEKQGKSLFEHGESYFNELINRSMIQPIYNMYTGMIEYFRVHDIVLDLIHSLSSEENFVTITNHIDHASASNMMRRLSLQSGKENLAMSQTTRRLEQVRSAVVFPSAANLMPALDSFRVLRVLDLEGCELAQGYSIKYLGNLFHLRYLGLRCTGIAQLPEEIGNLQFLQTLEVRDNEIYSLPLTVVHLRRLMYLYIDPYVGVPNGIGKLTCLEELSKLSIYDSTMDITEELGQLTELRLLHIIFSEWNDNLPECICKLQRIQNLYIEVPRSHRNYGGLDVWVAPRHLHTLVTQGSSWFSTLPAWINPSHLLDLSFLCIAVRELQQDNLETLGLLPALRYLDLEVNNNNLGIRGRFAVDAGSFPCLVHCKFWGFVWPVVVRQGGLPRLRELYLDLFLTCEVRETIKSDGGLDLGLGNLPSLQHILVHIVPESANIEEAEQAKAALRRAAKMHPNHPTLNIRMADSD